MLTVWYALGPYIKQTCFNIKGLNESSGRNGWTVSSNVISFMTCAHSWHPSCNEPVNQHLSSTLYIAIDSVLLMLDIFFYKTVIDCMMHICKNIAN